MNNNNNLFSQLNDKGIIVFIIGAALVKYAAIGDVFYYILGVFAFNFVIKLIFGPR